MSANPCLKNCAECASPCSGCPTSTYVGRCEIAKCCREKGHETCEGCTFIRNCRKHMDRSRMPELLIGQDRREEEQRQRNIRYAGRLAQWVKLIFWCWIAQLIFGILELEFLAESFPFVGHLGFGLTTLLMAVIGYCYLRLKDIDERFGFVGWLEIALTGYNILKRFLPEENVLIIVLTLAFGVLGVMSLYRMCMAYSDVLAEISKEHSEKWRNQWNMYRYSLYGLLGCIVLFLIPLVSLISVIGLLFLVGFMLFLEIREVVYLYQTAKVCAWFSQVQAGNNN